MSGHVYEKLASILRLTPAVALCIAINEEGVAGVDTSRCFSMQIERTS